MRIQFVCLLLMLLTITVISQNAKINRLYEKFIKQHIYQQMSAKKCNDVMRERNISKISKNKCKKINTFILSNIKTVRSVCVDKGEPSHNMTKSLERFNIVVCKLKEQKGRPANCQYSGKKYNKKIIIKCEKGFPVHYDGDIGHCEN